MIRYTCVLALSLAITAEARHTVTGTVTCGGCPETSALTVELYDSQRMLVQRVFVRPTGEFEMRADEGHYEILVLDARGETLKRDFVNVQPLTGPINMVINSRVRERPISGLVSAATLARKIDKKAIKQYKLAEKLFEKGDLAGSLGALERAVEMAPNYMQAYNNLGNRYMELGRTGEAAAAYRKALQLDPSSPLVNANYAVALWAAGDLQAAEAPAREAMRLDASSTLSRYILGLILFSQQKYTTETAGLLERAAEQFPRARLALAKLLELTGDTAAAQRQMSTYQASGFLASPK